MIVKTWVVWSGFRPCKTRYVRITGFSFGFRFSSVSPVWSTHLRSRSWRSALKNWRKIAKSSVTQPYVGCPIASKFGMLMQYGSTKAMKFWKSTSGQFQYGGRPHPNFQPLNCNNSATDCSISLKFDLYVHCGSAEVTKGLKSTYHEIQGGSPQNFQYLNRYNSAVDWSISLKFGTEFDNVTTDTLQTFKVKAQTEVTVTA